MDVLFNLFSFLLLIYYVYVIFRYLPLYLSFEAGFVL